jgi:hypothetical protein
MRSLLRLLAKTAARTCSVVFYCAVPNISAKARLKSRLSAWCHFHAQIGAGSWLSIRVVHNGWSEWVIFRAFVRAQGATNYRLIG